MGDMVVPEATNEHVKSLIKKLGLDGPPISVTVRPDTNAVRADCFGNVDSKVRAEGGEAVCGWCLWLFPGVWVESEFHAVWRSPDGELVDVTPKPDGDEHILFVPDPNRTYAGRTHNTVHHLILNTDLVRRFVKLISLRTDFLESRRKPGQQDVELADDDAETIMEIKAAERCLLDLVKQGGSKNRPCPCGSGSKFKHCHDKTLNLLFGVIAKLTSK